MKSTIKKLIIAATNNDILWLIIRPFAILGFFAVNNRKVSAQQIINHENDSLMAVFAKNEVLHGPFQGMKYPSSSSVGSSFYPKLIGCYERELHEVISKLLAEDYTELLDVGCAEGYYAIGIGLRLKNTSIYAYDTDDTAKALCYQMAKLNQIENRIHIKSTCTTDELANFKFTGKSLIICDCEGYENQLFNKGNIRNLRNCDLVIETHDFLNLNISDDLINLFSGTHDIQIIKSIDDIEKAKTYCYEETEHLTLQEKLELFREWRPCIMEWLICTPKRSSNA